MGQDVWDKTYGARRMGQDGMGQDVWDKTYGARCGELGLDCPGGILVNSPLTESHDWFFN